jgi:hypothetical protein
MPRTGHGGARYSKRAPTIQPHMVIDGVDLGAAMTPADVLIDLRVAAEMDDADIVDAMLSGADRVEADLARGEDEPQVLRVLSVDDRMAAIAEVRGVTASRVMAWRKRNRQMTWAELRVLLVGLRGVL